MTTWRQELKPPSPHRSLPGWEQLHILLWSHVKTNWNARAQRGCDRPRKLTMPAVSAVEFRPLLTFLGSIDNLTLQRPSSLFSMLVTVHLTSVPGENMSGREFSSCPATWPTETHRIFTMLNNIRLEFVIETHFEKQNPVRKSCFSVNTSVTGKRCHKHQDLNREAVITLCHVSKTARLCLKTLCGLESGDCSWRNIYRANSDPNLASPFSREKHHQQRGSANPTFRNTSGKFRHHWHQRGRVTDYLILFFSSSQLLPGNCKVCLENPVPNQG